MTKAVIKFIEYYQFLFSPDHSFWAKQRFPYGYCRFYPSCSEYGKQVVAKHGLMRGLWKIIGRLLRCNPFTAGGLDPAD